MTNSTRKFEYSCQHSLLKCIYKTVISFLLKCQEPGVQVIITQEKPSPEAMVPVPKGSTLLPTFGFAKHPDSLNQYFNIEQHCPLFLWFGVTCQFQKPLTIKGQWSILPRTEQTSTVECRATVTQGEHDTKWRNLSITRLLSAGVVVIVVTRFSFFIFFVINCFFTLPPASFLSPLFYEPCQKQTDSDGKKQQGDTLKIKTNSKGC